MSHSATSFSKNAVEVEALVISVEERQGDNGTVFRPTFEAKTPSGNSVQYVGNTWVAPKPHEANETVSAYYDQASGVIRSDVLLNQFQFMGSMFMGIGGIFAVLGVSFFGRRRYLRHQKA
ncbi:MAG: hypothetical protein ACRBB0_19195 [Pelagimonas sp.]|uniref:hypothetical protein n=1 Tax=Pelagimonas sp. TaxID=2073170 RepID=UPI003D6AC739